MHLPLSMLIQSKQRTELSVCEIELLLSELMEEHARLRMLNESYKENIGHIIKQSTRSIEQGRHSTSVGFFKSILHKKIPASQSAQLNQGIGLFVRRDPHAEAGIEKRFVFQEKRFLDQVQGIDRFADVQLTSNQYQKTEINNPENSRERVQQKAPGSDEMSEV